MAVKEVAKKMPYSIEAEQAVLGCVLINDNACSVIMSSIKPNAFYSRAHKSIFECMQKIYEKNQPVDYVTLISELENDNKLTEVGGVEYVTQLTNAVPTAVNFEHYANIVKKDYILRELINAGQNIAEMAYGSDDSVEALKYAEKVIFDIGESESVSDLEQIGPSMKGVLDKFQVIASDRDSLRGLSTGLYGLDKCTNGLQPGDLILLAARPGVGKTSLAMNLVNFAALEKGAVCAIFSLEMPKSQLAQRSLCSASYVSMEKALKGELSSDDWASLWAANKKFQEAKIFVDDNSTNSAMDILSKCRKLKRERGRLDLVMIDYLQLMQGKSSKEANRQQEISDITRALKIAAKELNVPILLLSQLSRKVEERPDHRPMLADLRESGAIEQDADIVMFIYNPDNYLKDPAMEKKGIVELIIAKHRNGPLDTIKLKFERETTSFRNLSREAEAESLERTMPSIEKKKKQLQEENVPAPEMVPLDDSGVSDIF